MTHLSDDERYSWLNDAYCVVVGEVHSRPDDGFEVVMDVVEVVWEPLRRPREARSRLGTTADRPLQRTAGEASRRRLHVPLDTERVP
jgi:hypothetical protein